MFSSTPLLLAALALLGPSVSALPHPARTESSLRTRAGPSGYVIYPPGGTSFDIIGSAGGGITYVNIQYQKVESQTPYAGTVGVDLYLEDPTGALADIPIAYNFGGANTSASVIEGNFVPASGACAGTGTWNLVFIEHQNDGNYGDIIEFRAAAPSINIVCSPEE